MLLCWASRQAFFVADLFLDFVVNLAAKCNGKFKVRKSAGAAHDEGVEVAAWNGCEESRSRFELGGIKSIESAARKYSVSYRGDVSMLLDMVSVGLGTNRTVCARSIVVCVNSKQTLVKHDRVYSGACAPARPRLTSLATGARTAGEGDALL